MAERKVVLDVDGVKKTLLRSWGHMQSKIMEGEGGMYVRLKGSRLVKNMPHSL